MSRLKSCKKWRNGLFKSFKILFCAERNSGEVCVGYIPFCRGNVNLGIRTVLASELENELVEFCIIMDQRYCGLRWQDIKGMVFKLAINGLKHPFNQEKSVDGKKWLQSFLKRHPVLSMRTPEGISAAQLKGFTSENSTIFDIYESELRKVNHKAHRYSMLMQQGLQLCNTGTVKLSARKKWPL